MDRTKSSPYVFLKIIHFILMYVTIQKKRSYFIATFIVIIQSFFSSELLFTRVSSVNVGRPCLTKTHMQNTCEVCVIIHGLE